MDNILRISANISDDPFQPKYIDIDFDMDKLKVISNELIEACSNKKYQSSYQYNPHVEKVIEKIWDEKCGAKRPFYRALACILRKNIKSNSLWSDGDVAALRVLESKIAYLTPGFIEAKRYNELYGS